MSAPKEESVPCFQCLRKVVCDGAEFESMCSLEIGSQKHCNQCPSDQACDPLPFCFMMMLKELRQSKCNENGFKTSLESKLLIFKDFISLWDQEVALGRGGNFHAMTTFFEACHETMAKDDFERLINIRKFGLAAYLGITDMRLNDSVIQQADELARMERMEARIMARMKERWKVKN